MFLTRPDLPPLNLFFFFFCTQQGMADTGTPPAESDWRVGRHTAEQQLPPGSLSVAKPSSHTGLRGGLHVMSPAFYFIFTTLCELPQSTICIFAICNYFLKPAHGAKGSNSNINNFFVVSVLSLRPVYQCSQMHFMALYDRNQSQL